MGNVRKQLTAKAAWARVGEDSRRLRAALERIEELAAAEQGMAAERLREICQVARRALAAGERDRAA